MSQVGDLRASGPGVKLGSHVAMLGYGRFGQALAQLIIDSGLRVSAFDPVAAVPEALAAASPAELVREAFEVFIAVPTVETKNALRLLQPHVTPQHTVIDVGSVKHGAVQAMMDVLGETVPWVATHPLFGSSSIALGERPLVTVVCPNPLHPQAAARARTLYERMGCIVTEQDAADHDRAMARSHALAFFVAKALMDMGAGEGLSLTPPSFQALARTIELVRTDAAHLFLAIERENPYAAAARQELLDALLRVHSRLESMDGTAASPDETPEGLDIPDLGTHSPELMETRDLIDELDQDLLRLLGRRAQLSRRAGSIKAIHGKSVRDPSRERTLLEFRRQWARELDLEPDAIADIFAAVLRFSRGVQTK
ncbi:MAG: prephenate dehydrogenase/arogenate dehydrogenase family protein [Pirellulaceae bacterium]